MKMEYFNLSEIEFIFSPILDVRLILSLPLERETNIRSADQKLENELSIDKLN